MRRARKGFTLIELMIVAIIVAILAVALIPLMTGNTTRAYATEAEAALGTIRSALRVHWAENKAYPVLEAGAVVDRVPGIEAGDLLGTFFDDENYTITSTANSYIVTCTFNADDNSAPQAAKVNTLGHTVTLDQDGDFDRSY